MTPRIKRGEHAAGDAVQVAIERALQAAQAVVIGAYVAQHLRRQLIVRIKTLEFFLEVHALEIEGLHPRDLRRIELTRDPGEVPRGVQPRSDLLR